MFLLLSTRMTKPNNKIPTNPYNDKYSSLIRPIKIFLPTQGEKEKIEEHKYDDFVGRERLMEKLFNWLSDKNKESGSYLVTGFRGMGKTILVDRVVGKLTREVNERHEPWWLLLSLLPVIVMGVMAAIKPSILELDGKVYWIVAVLLSVWFAMVVALYYYDSHKFNRIKKRARRNYPNHEKFDEANVDKMARGKNDDYDSRHYRNIKISINLGHEVLKERDVLSMIATSVRDKYKAFVRSSIPHLIIKSSVVMVVSVASFALVFSIQNIRLDRNKTEINKEVAVRNTEVSIDLHNSPITVKEDVSNEQNLVVSGNSDNTNNQQVFVKGDSSESWFSRLVSTATKVFVNVYKDVTGLSFMLRFVLFILTFIILTWLFEKLFRWLPYFSTPIRALRRLDVLTERLNTVMGEETGMAPSASSSVFTLSLFNRRKQKTKPIADIREIETELADIINLIYSDKCIIGYRVNFIVVFDEMDKIDPAMMEQHKSTEMPEFTDSVKGFPDGMDSRERRRNVLKLLANIKLFVSTAKAKFVFISGRELYDAYLADLSDRDFAISSIFSGVINVDSFLTPEGSQTDVRSMSEWYITNRMIPHEWLEETEKKNAEGKHPNDETSVDWAVLKSEKPSLRWYYEYLIDVIDKSEVSDEEKKKRYRDASYVTGFLHTFAAYLTHISNGSPKKIFLYFDKYIRYAKDCLPMNDWDDMCTVGEEKSVNYQRVLYFEPLQQRTINFVYYLSNPIMGAITNDMSDYGDRFLVSLSFIIDHIYKYHNRSFSWRNLEQIPDLLKTSKAPELRDEMTSIMEYLSQIHISPILIGLNEYKFHKSIAEEISVMSRMSDEASAIFNFTLDESLSVIQYNTRLLNYYIELDKEGNKDNEENHKHKYLPLIARIHSNLGDLHFWDEDYYSATLEYRAAIETLPDSKEDESGFLTRVRCMLKLGLAYELRKLYPNAYQTYCRLINQLIKKRWVNEVEFGLSVMDARNKGWQDKRQVMVYSGVPSWYENNKDLFKQQFERPLIEGNYNEKQDAEFNFNFDGIITTFAKDLTVEKTQTINTLTLFEEIRYLYQSILAKLSIVEKMGMSGITQTNISVAEGEFRTIHKSVNIREKFIIAADFFRKLAEILYYKNSLTILTQNQDSFYVSVYYDDHDLLANLDDYCMRVSDNAISTRHDVRYFFYRLNNSASGKQPKLDYPTLNENKWCYLKDLYAHIIKHVGDILNNDKELDKKDRDRVQKNVINYLEYNRKIILNEKEVFYYRSVESCNYHTKLLRENGLRTPCYACKYYTRSLRILTANMFEEDLLDNTDAKSNDVFTKSIEILKHSFKDEMLYANSTNIRALAQTLEGLGNVMYACASGDDCEGNEHKSKHGISKEIIVLLQKLNGEEIKENQLQLINGVEKDLRDKKHFLSRLDKSILYYWDAYRFYLMDASYNDAVGCLGKILNLMVYYIEVLCYFGNNHKLMWEDEVDTIEALIGDSEFDNSFVATLFQLIIRYSSYKYDFTNLNEINEMKWIYSKEMRDNIDLTKLSLYPTVRSAWLRAVEIRAKGLNYLGRTEEYVSFIGLTYPLITPRCRYETTFYEEVMGYYTKMRYNDHVLNNLMGGNPMIDKKIGDYANPYHIAFYERLLGYLESEVDYERLDYTLFEIGKRREGHSELIKRRLELLEFLIHDTLVCITDMVNVFTPHNHLTSYSKSFVGLVYNYYWEWSRKYEFLYGLYQYQELRAQDRTEEAEKIISNIWGSGSIQSDKGFSDAVKEKHRDSLREVMEKFCDLISKNCFEKGHEKKYGSRSDRLYERLRHDIDDITINTIYSNYTAEMALKCFHMAEEANTEGEAYKEMIGSMHFLNDDMNNDTCQFNIACDRFLLNTGVVAEQRRRLEKLYKNSNVYNLRKGYIDGPNNLNREEINPNQFDRSQFINSEY